MTHLSEEEILDAYYGDLAAGRAAHLKDCPECRAEALRLSELLDELRTVPTPERGDGYGREVWARLESRLPGRKRRWWAPRWVLAPAGAALLAAAFVAGMLTVRPTQRGTVTRPAMSNQAGISDEDRQRVFLAAMADHLDRSEIFLAQLLHASPAELNANDERGRARDLIEENRLLRATAGRSEDQGHAALLDDLERVFLDLANSPDHLSSEDVTELRRRVEEQGLLFKVRVTTTDARAKGQTL